MKLFHDYGFDKYNFRTPAWYVPSWRRSPNFQRLQLAVTLVYKSLLFLSFSTFARFFLGIGFSSPPPPGIFVWREGQSIGLRYISWEIWPIYWQSIQNIKKDSPYTGFLFLPAKNREMPSIPNFMNVLFIFVLKDTGRKCCITHSVSTVLSKISQFGREAFYNLKLQWKILQSIARHVR